MDRSSILELFRFVYGGAGGKWVRNTVPQKEFLKSVAHSHDRLSAIEVGQ